MSKSVEPVRVIGCIFVCSGSIGIFDGSIAVSICTCHVCSNSRIYCSCGNGGVCQGVGVSVVTVAEVLSFGGLVALSVGVVVVVVVVSVCVAVSVGVVIVAVMVSVWVKVMVLVSVCIAEVVMVSVEVVVEVSISMLVEVLSVGVVWVVGVAVTVSNAGIVGISCVSSLSGDDINDSSCVSDSRCSVSSGGKSYVSCVIVVVYRFFDGFYDQLRAFLYSFP